VIPSIFVTHDQEEALEMADRVVIMNPGEIEQAGMPGQVYDTPANPFVYQFLGSVVRVETLREDNHDLLDVEVTREQFRQLELQVQDQTWLTRIVHAP
jgi:ABC-type sulfate/molybdate transport systems ATPase subunit